MKFGKLVAVIMALVSNMAFAGIMGPVCPAEEVTVPCDKNGWDFGIQALYLNPSYRGVFNLVNRLIPNELTPEGRWGFRVEVSHHFNHGSDIYISWNHHDNKTIYTALDGATIAAQSFEIKANHKWDAVNAELGQTVSFGHHKKIRFFGGAQYARIDNHFKVTIRDTPPTESFFMEFEGLGPRLGIDMSNSWGGFSFYLKTAAAVLTGNHSFNSTTFGVLDINGNIQRSNLGIVPSLENKLGLTYSYALAQSDLFFDAGYRWLNYFSAQTLNTVSRRATGSDTDFGLNGPYIGVKYMGYV